MSDGSDIISRFREAFQEQWEHKFSQSWFCQDRTERNARLKAIISLSVEYERCREINVFGSAAAKGVIENIIEGDWKYAEECANDMTFKEMGLDELDRLKYAKLWEGFVAMAQKACLEARLREAGEESQVS